MSALDPERELRRSLALARASWETLHGAIGAYVIETDWQPGQPIPEHVRRLRCAHDDLRHVIDVLADVLERR